MRALPLGIGPFLAILAVLASANLLNFTISN